MKSVPISARRWPALHHKFFLTSRVPLRYRLATSISAPRTDISRHTTRHYATPTMASINPTPSSEEPLPKLTPSEFRQFNRMADGMDYYHNHFRSTWRLMMTACEKNKRPDGMSIRQFIQTGQQLVSQLTMHHGIEETHIFPVLAKKMPAFQKELELLTQHKEIHKGLNKLDEYLDACRKGERELRMGELKNVMESFGEVLWQHLDDEVKQLGAENMRKFWTIEEIKRMPM